MTGHLDALGVAFFLCGLFVPLVYVLDRRYTVAADVKDAMHKALRAMDHDAYHKLWHRWQDTLRGQTRHIEHVDQAVDVAKPNEPIPYLPAWTTGAPHEDIDERFTALINHAYGKGNR